MPPAWAMAMASRPSVTVSMAEESTGILTEICRVTREATLVSAGEAEESIYVRMGLEGDGHVAIVLDRPQALDAWPGDSVFDVDDDEGDQSLLGTGFALRLARNLASELGGTLVFGTATLTLRLPAADAVEVGQAQQR